MISQGETPPSTVSELALTLLLNMVQDSSVSFYVVADGDQYMEGSVA